MSIDRNELLDILREWSFWDEPPPRSVVRSLSQWTTVDPGVVTVIQGVRRSGKSTLLAQLTSQFGLSREKCVFVNFEDPRLSQSLHFTILDEILAVATNHIEGPLIFFLDEIQSVFGWEKWLNARLERPKGHTFIITGSNSQLLGGELATSLTGRHLTYEVFPFSFKEFLLMKPKASLQQYLQSGGFPGALQASRPERLLQQYFQDIVEKDIRERLGAKSSQPLRSLAQMVLESTGSETSLRRIAGAVGISPETASQYINACENAYLILSCPFFAFSESKRLRHNRKYYSIDTGLRRAVCSRMSADFGKDFENLVFLALKKKDLSVFYWRGKGEVDFVVQSKSGITPIQVTWKEPKPRHEESLTSFYTEFPFAQEAVFVTPESYDELVLRDF
ncbi:MAG: ATP-binding protein [Pseudomonadota bacterium]